jgi:hypothetical protein
VTGARDTTSSHRQRSPTAESKSMYEGSNAIHYRNSKDFLSHKQEMKEKGNTIGLETKKYPSEATPVPFASSCEMGFFSIQVE